MKHTKNYNTTTKMAWRTQVWENWRTISGAWYNNSIRIDRKTIVILIT